MYNVIVYVLKDPVIYNEGTQWEKKEDTFLLCYTPFKDDEINEIVDELNKTKAESILDTPIDWDKIAYLKVHKQPIFD